MPLTDAYCGQYAVERKMKEESSKAFDAWIQLKDMRDEALSCLGFIAPPQVTPSTSQGPTVATNSRGRLNNAEVRGSRNGSMNNLHQNSIATPLADVMTIGKSLKMVDRTLLADWAKWAGNIMSFNTASILWDSFPPTACDVHSAQYSQVCFEKSLISLWDMGEEMHACTFSCDSNLCNLIG